MAISLSNILLQNKSQFHPIIHLEANDHIFPLDLSEANQSLTPEVITDTEAFSEFIDQSLQSVGCKYGIGGYNELRNLYSRSDVFGSDEPRRLHLGVDIWGPVATPVFAPLSGHIHSFKYNGSFGDYGATLILKHEIEDQVFYTLYGHLSLSSINQKIAGDAVAAGDEIAMFGPSAENGDWPSHLHFQIIADIEGQAGDYPGVCRVSEKDKYLNNCPDANLMLNLNTD
jgi:peptidoglycan LD-endopeptidase LytH